jgi:hypothetical protein
MSLALWLDLQWPLKKLDATDPRVTSATVGLMNAAQIALFARVADAHDHEL